VLYQIQSKNGWTTLAVNEKEAKAMADHYHSRWWGMGVDVPVEVYREGDLIYTAIGDPNKSATP
jgi:hypothetical protein